MTPDSPIEDLSRLTAPQKVALKKLRIGTIRDLLYHFPSRYADLGEINTISNLKAGEKATIYGEISRLKTGKAFRKRMSMAEGEIADNTGKIKVVWFNQPYIAKMLQDGAMVKLSGKVTERKGSLYLANPEVEASKELPIDIGDSLFALRAQAGGKKQDEAFIPIYPESKGITSRWFYYNIRKILESDLLNEVEDPIPENILSKYHLPNLKSALVWIHAPKKRKHEEAARKRFAFEEIFFIQLSRQKERLEYEKHKSYVIKQDRGEIEKFIGRFPFKATVAQQNSIETILKDFESGKPMSRLLEGDVGSGKTAVAATTAYAVISSREILPRQSASSPQLSASLQVAYMAPTEILATQHFESFIQYFKHLPIQIGLITGSGCRKFPSKVNPSGWTDISRAQLLKWVKNGEIAILLGTHALIQKAVEFKNLAYIIIDEQHRFGIAQRMALARGKRAERTPNIAEGPMDPLIYRDLTYRIRNALFNVKKELGVGHKEIVYQKSVVEEFERAKLSFSREVQIPIFYKGKKVGTYIPDFVVENKIIVELKALNFVGTTEKKQVWSYLKGSDYHLALLVNFGPKELTIERIIYDKSRNSSASVPHDSASIPHLLSMTATPIPRTLALTIYGDLDLSLLDEMPAGRKRVITEIVSAAKRNEAYEKIRNELAQGRQAYVICPRINEPDPDKESALIARSVKEEAKRLGEKIFPEYTIDILHSKMKPSEKDETMSMFAEGKTDILVATSVVEVGVNVPNSTIIVIEGAERFGLAQLHQLRGRVIRSNHQAYCYLFPESAGDKTKARLHALVTAKNGFELSELDLALRGAGELSGAKQWGISDLGMEAIKNIKMVEAAREEARAILTRDADLKTFPLLKTRLAQNSDVHFE